jgi:hypothetical protein
MWILDDKKNPATNAPVAVHRKIREALGSYNTGYLPPLLVCHCRRVLYRHLSYRSL